MAKTVTHNQARPVQSQAWGSVVMPADADVQRLLTGTGTLHENLFNEMASHADPSWRAQRTVTFPAEKGGALADEIRTVLRRARAAGDPGAGAIAGVAALLGGWEPEPAPAADEGVSLT